MGFLWRFLDASAVRRNRRRRNDARPSGTDGEARGRPVQCTFRDFRLSCQMVWQGILGFEPVCFPRRLDSGFPLSTL